MATGKQKRAARRNVKKAQQAAAGKKTVAHRRRLAKTRADGTNWWRGAGPRSAGAEVHRILTGAVLRAACLG
jgi:hypothetical protein